MVWSRQTAISIAAGIDMSIRQSVYADAASKRQECKRAEEHLDRLRMKVLTVGNDRG